MEFHLFCEHKISTTAIGVKGPGVYQGDESSPLATC